LPYLASAIAVVFLLLGAWLLFRPLDQTAILAKVRESRRAELLDEIAALETQRKADEIGPSYYEHRRRDLTDELAIVLHMQSEAGSH
jgi:cytochrome oxidase assembly protein ShyY1